MSEILDRIFDATDDAVEFQPDYAPEMLCLTTRLAGHPVSVIANRRGFLKSSTGPRIGGIVYTESARKVDYFVENSERSRTPIIYMQDVSGFMVGAEAESEGIIRAGAGMVESMACATVPKIVLTINHASGAGYYAMAGQGFDPSFTFGWPTARIGVMEGDSAVMAIHGPELERLKREKKPIPQELQDRIARTRADYERWLDARHAAARGHVDALIDPLMTRRVLQLALETTLWKRHSEHTVLETIGGSISPVVLNCYSRRWDDPNRQRAGLLGGLAGGTGPTCRGRSNRLSDARLSGRGHDVDPQKQRRQILRSGMREIFHLSSASLRGSFATAVSAWWQTPAE